MAQNSKRGMRSDSQKRDRSRYDFDPIPAATPVEGAFGRAIQADDQEQPAGDRESGTSER
jgi:hypothetical protein